MAQAFNRALKRKEAWPSSEQTRLLQLEKELSKYSRFEDAELKRKVALRIASLEAELVQGNEQQALAKLLDNGHYRGTDIRLTVDNTMKLVSWCPILHIAGCGEMCCVFVGNKKLI